MGELIGIFSQLNPKKILVLGDFMLDTYTMGKAKRISPEAPVAVLLVQKEEHRPGGVGNVLLNLQAVGAEVIPMGRVGNDPAGVWLQQHFASSNIPSQGLVVQERYPTPVKNRILADNQQIVRVDHESTLPLDPVLEQHLISILPQLVQGVDLVAISDYGKGFLTDRLLKAVMEISKSDNIPVITDPKGTNFAKYRGTTLIKPNLGEAFAAANLTPDAPLDLAAQRILHTTDAEALMVTLSEAGISIFYRGGEREDFPVKIREVRDVTGAGDTVLAMLAFAMANGLSLASATRLANVAAGMAIERFGCAQISLHELARRLFEEDLKNKVFDEQHLYTLKAALHGHRFKVLSLSTADGMSLAMFHAIQNLGEDPKCDLLVHLSDPSPDPDFVQLLSSLHSVSFIILNRSSLSSLFDSLVPEAVYGFSSGKCVQLESIHCV